MQIQAFHAFTLSFLVRFSFETRVTVLPPFLHQSGFYTFSLASIEFNVFSRGIISKNMSKIPGYPSFPGKTILLSTSPFPIHMAILFRSTNKYAT